MRTRILIAEDSATQAELLRQVEQLADRPVTADEVAQAKQRMAERGIPVRL